MACLDIFTKVATVVPIRSKKPDDYLAGFMECMKNMGKKPKLIYSDNEGSLNSNDILGYLKKEGIDIITTRNHAHVVERFIRTIKIMIRKRIDHDIKNGKENVQWHSYLYPSLLTYNNKNEHSSIGMTPAEAEKKEKEIDVKMALELRAKRERRYPELKIKDKVKIMLKFNKFKKEHQPTFSDNKYEIENIEKRHGLNIYTVNGRPRLRNELLLVKS